MKKLFSLIVMVFLVTSSLYAKESKSETYFGDAVVSVGGSDGDDLKLGLEFNSHIIPFVKNNYGFGFQFGGLYLNGNGYKKLNSGYTREIRSCRVVEAGPSEESTKYKPNTVTVKDSISSTSTDTLIAYSGLTYDVFSLLPIVNDIIPAGLDFKFGYGVGYQFAEPSSFNEQSLFYGGANVSYSIGDLALMIQYKHLEFTESDSDDDILMFGVGLNL